MGSCKIDAYDDLDGSGPGLFSGKDLKARKAHRCCECGRVISPGEFYRYEFGVWDGTPESYHTCVDCMSLRSGYFTSWRYGTIWEDFASDVLSSNGAFDSTVIPLLTPAAREKAFACIEDVWRQVEEWEARYERKRGRG